MQRRVPSTRPSPPDPSPPHAWTQTQTTADMPPILHLSAHAAIQRERLHLPQSKVCSKMGVGHADADGSRDHLAATFDILPTQVPERQCIRHFTGLER